MGYSHYWYRSRSVPEPPDAYARFAMGAKRIIEQAQSSGIALAGWDGGEQQPRPEMTEGYIRLNGCGDEAHETFTWCAEIPPVDESWSNDPDEDFDFCKTAMKPYDAVVCALLILAKSVYGPGVRISSDGEWNGWEWLGARILYTDAMNEEPVYPFGQPVR